jgi:hypothetical protein
MPCGSCNPPFYKDPFTSNCGDVCPDVNKKISQKKKKNSNQKLKLKIKLKSKLLFFFNLHKNFFTTILFFRNISKIMLLNNVTLVLLTALLAFKLQMMEPSVLLAILLNSYYSI